VGVGRLKEEVRSEKLEVQPPPTLSFAKEENCQARTLLLK
jgi:hypothetical protein